ncbi:hypothetical protein EIP86_007392, partial [Pleurotus ostreatoroseus]
MCGPERPLMNAASSCTSKSGGHLPGAKILTYAIDPSRLQHVAHEERTCHVFHPSTGFWPRQDVTGEPLIKSIGEGSKQLNYGKVYCGLDQLKGYVVP